MSESYTLASSARPRRLCTFSGKHGDILWSLATARALSVNDGQPVDFAITAPYRNLSDLIEQQDYIGKVIVMEDWICPSSPFCDQPWKAPVESNPLTKHYQVVSHLAYRCYPTEHLMTFCATQQGICLSGRQFPFLKDTRTSASAVALTHTPTGHNEENKEGDAKRLTTTELAHKESDNGTQNHNSRDKNLIALGFSHGPRSLFPREKHDFIQRLTALLPPGMRIVDLNDLKWADVPNQLYNSFCFVGCRSSLAVCCHGTATPAIIWEPMHLHLNPIFGEGGHGIEFIIQSPEEAISKIIQLSVANA